MESYRWVESMKTSATVLDAAARVTVMADRDGHLFEMFACSPEGVDVLIRASRDRKLSDETGKLFSNLEGKPQQEHMIELPARPGQRKRTAPMGVRFSRDTLMHLSNKPLEPSVSASKAVYIVEAREIHPPKGVKSAHWRLLTSHRIETFEQARWITQLYCRRWVIGQVFRTIKNKGFGIENNSMATEPFKIFCALVLILGISCMQLLQDRDGAGKRPLGDVFNAEEQPILEAASASLEGKTEKQKNLHPKGSLAFAAWVCSRLGGWNGYYRKPDPAVMQRRLYRIRSIRLGYGIAGNA